LVFGRLLALLGAAATAGRRPVGKGLLGFHPSSAVALKIAIVAAVVVTFKLASRRMRKSE
jgi:hypothetical protein